jgi:hypothetical protein
LTPNTNCQLQVRVRRGYGGKGNGNAFLLLVAARNQNCVGFFNASCRSIFATTLFLVMTLIRQGGGNAPSSVLAGSVLKSTPDNMFCQQRRNLELYLRELKGSLCCAAHLLRGADSNTHAKHLRNRNPSARLSYFERAAQRNHIVF